MPELPEVETTKRGLQKEIVGLLIKDVWTDLATKDKRKHDTVADVKYFPIFKKQITSKKVLSVERRAKNILINLSGGKTILIHMKMTGHLLYGKYILSKKENKWSPSQKNSSLTDPFNRFIHVVFTLSNGNYLAFSDARKFGKITLLNTADAHTGKHLKDIGPEPLEKSFKFVDFIKQLEKKPRGKIKTVLMDQTVIAGIGNIYSDEILWMAGVHPERKALAVKDAELRKIFKAMKETLKKGINLGGDSMSDYRNLYGNRGKFQLHHNAYQLTGKVCKKKRCYGKIVRKIVNGRSAHFCSIHQK